MSRYFDAPFTESTVAGGQTLGLLPTDRPHVFKFAGAYSLDWNKRFGMLSNHTTELQGFFTAQSGTPQTTIASIAGYNTVMVNGRGDIGRTAMFTSTDLALRHRYRFGRDNRFTLVGEIDALNVFNRNSVVARYTIIDTDNYALDEPDFGLITEAEIDALVDEFGETIGHARALALAELRFQQNGAPGILSLINSGETRDPRYLQPLSYQAPREIRFGFRFLF